MPILSFSDVSSLLDAPHWYTPWRAEFDASASWAEGPDVVLPRGAELLALCDELGLPSPSGDTLVAHRASFDDPRVLRLAAHVQWLGWERYAPQNHFSLGWPPPPKRCPLLYAYAAVGLARRTAAAHAAQGIAPEVTRATFWDVGKQVVLHERIHGEVGMPKGWWVVHHLASHLFRLGRLQFARAVAGRDLGPISTGDAYLDAHIPEDGAFPPEACDDSFRRARAFFARHYPGDGPQFYACSSWLLDPELLELVPRSSNIAHFQRRFRIVEVVRDRSSVFEFVFDRPDLDRAGKPDLTGLPTRTTLERALVEHYAQGRRIGSAVGVIPIERGEHP